MISCRVSMLCSSRNDGAQTTTSPRQKAKNQAPATSRPAGCGESIEDR
jgi:hypothetical protein